MKAGKDADGKEMRRMEDVGADRRWEIGVRRFFLSVLQRGSCTGSDSKSMV